MHRVMHLCRTDPALAHGKPSFDLYSRMYWAHLNLFPPCLETHIQFAPIGVNSQIHHLPLIRGSTRGYRLRIRTWIKLSSGSSETFFLKSKFKIPKSPLYSQLHHAMRFSSNAETMSS